MDCERITPQRAWKPNAKISPGAEMPWKAKIAPTILEVDVDASVSVCLLTVEVRARKCLYDSQTDQEISWRNEAGLNDVFPQQRDDNLWERRNVNDNPK
jgi:hypothetical protein